MNPTRTEKVLEYVRKSQLDLTVVLENIYDIHNIGAIMRTCDAVGVREIYVLYTEGHNRNRFKLGKRSSSGTRKWIDVHIYEDAKECFDVVRAKYKHIAGTHLSEESVSLYDVKLADSIALVFGNECDGITEGTLKYVDTNFTIPQMGMAQSLNVSVACAVTLYEAYRQRDAIGNYAPEKFKEEKQALFDKYEERLHKRYVGDQPVND